MKSIWLISFLVAFGVDKNVMADIPGTIPEAHPGLEQQSTPAKKMDTLIYKQVFAEGDQSILLNSSSLHGNTALNLDFALSTRLLASDYEFSPGNPREMRINWLPIEVKIRVPMNQFSGLTGSDLQALRVGLVRFLFSKTSLTIDLMQGVYHRYNAGIGDLLGPEVVGITYNRAFPLHLKNDNLELVLRGYSSFSYARSRSADPAVKDYHNIDPSFQPIFATYISGGIRIHKRALMSIFGGGQFAVPLPEKPDTSGYIGYDNSSPAVGPSGQAFFGLQTYVQFYPWLRLYGDVSQDYYYVYVDPIKSLSPSEKSPISATSTNLGVNLSW